MRSWVRLAAPSLLLSSLLVAGIAFAQARFDFRTAPGNLSKDVVPSRYNIALDLDPAKDTFSGTATITLRIAGPTPSFEIHAHELSAISAVLTADSGRARPLTVQPGNLFQSWRLTASDGSAFDAGEYVLRIEYQGKVQSTGSGLFRVPYTTRGQREVMLATQLEAIFARMVFPCFDEPAFRAVFQISVIAPSIYAVHSNMPSIASTVVSARSKHTQHRFAPTPSMPTYLVALTVGRFAALKGEAAGVPLHIYTAPGKQHQAAYAMEVTKKVVPFFTEYFGVPYSLPKLDQLAVPGIRDGAMEDWGLISYSEDALLFDPTRSGFNARREVFNMVAHEVAHQWFGNLVTAASWEEIWLNEAFANWMEAKASERFNSEWHERLRRRPWLDRTMTGDSGSATRAIRASGVTERNVFDVFDPITYDKGGAVLAMLEQWIGEKVFQQGLAQYMKERQFSNATAGDLWHHMQVASGKDVADVATSWTEQQGFPVVYLTARCTDGQTIVELKQSRFALGLQPLPAQLWKIPVSLTRGQERRSMLLEQTNGNATLPGCSDVPVLANGDGLGFYRVSYDPATLQRLTKSFARLMPEQQSVLLSDTFALAQAGHATMAQYFGVVAAIPTVSGAGRSALFSLAIDHLKFLATATAGTAAHERVRAAARALLAPELALVGWEPRSTDSTDTVSLRNNLIARLAYFGDSAVIERAARQFDAAVASGAALPAGTRSSIVVAAGAGADRARLNRLLSLLTSTDSEDDRWIYARALASVRDPTLAAALLEHTTEKRIASNVATRIPGMLAENSSHGALAYRYTLDHWSKLAAIAGNLFGESSQLLPSAATSFNDFARAQALMVDQAREAGDSGQVSAQRAAARIELQAMVGQRDSAALDALLVTWRPQPAR